MIMPYGKFKDKQIHELPSPYLKWLAENIDENNKQNTAICQAADEEWQFREKNNCHEY